MRRKNVQEDDGIPRDDSCLHQSSRLLFLLSFFLLVKKNRHGLIWAFFHLFRHEKQKSLKNVLPFAIFDVFLQRN